MTTAVPYPGALRGPGIRPLPEVDRWGRYLVLASVVVWPSVVAIGFARAVSVLTFVSMAAIALGFFRPRIGMLGLGMALTLDAVSRMFLATGGIFRFNTLNYCLILVTMGFLPLLLIRNDVHTRLLLGLTLFLGSGILISAAPEMGAQHVLTLASVFGI